MFGVFVKLIGAIRAIKAGVEFVFAGTVEGLGNAISIVDRLDSCEGEEEN